MKIPEISFEGRSAFIVTKPLQLMIAGSIIDQLGIKDNVDILLTDDFSGSRAAFERYKATNNAAPWGEMKFFDCKSAAFRHIQKQKNYKQILVDSDVGARNALQLARLLISYKKVRIFAYEEGIGTYRSDLYASTKKFILDRFGVGTCFGGSAMTSGIFVHEPERYKEATKSKARMVCGIRKSLGEFILHNMEFLSYLFGFSGIPHSGNNDYCLLYLTNYSFDQKIISQFRNNGKDFFVKPHPHIKNINPTALGVDADALLPAVTPAEIIIKFLRDRYEKVTVYHHGSSAAYYMSDSDVKFILL
ncbi:hypothetical protein MU516_16395 [Paracoccus sp. YLB-12]|uniref:Uncharacterized protein n=1 Tax=Paracoccus maritimus TaxID=2933292 RepID=A0ABT2KEP5_9RHOB|nr:hypothetical protein [Paracoccus sp. YLB-12]MCT4334439.1 hypothetical protein [Paracoccus sp. YLB-12]